MAYTFHIVDSRTGIKQLEVFPSSGSWSRVLNAGGKGTHTFVLTADQAMRDRVLSTPWSRTLVVSWDGVAVYAGLIVRRVYSQDDNTLTVSHEDFRSLLQRRYPFGVNSYTQDGTTATGAGWLTLTALTLRAIVVRVLQEGLVGPFPIYSMPVFINSNAIASTPLAAESGGYSRTYENFAFLTVEQIIDNVQDEEGGPDTDFEPVWVDGVFQWNARIGSPSTPKLYSTAPGGNPFEFNMGAEQRVLTGVTVTDDGAKQATGVFSIGEGSGRDMKLAGNGFGSSATIPALDVAESFKDEKSYDILFSYSNGALPVRGKTTTQYELGMLATEIPGLSALRIGVLFRLIWSGNPWVADGNVDLRVISLSGSMTNDLTIDVQPWG